jgi:hypothetical protein
MRQDISSPEWASSWFHFDSEASGVDLRCLSPGTVLTVHTCHTCYRIVVIDGPRGHVAVQGGSWFPDETPARIDGCNGGGASLRTRWIGTGLHLEIVRADRERIVTSRVRSIEVMTPSSN